jgi:pimeloyl-ACP methyl ester carboxylesterase
MYPISIFECKQGARRLSSSKGVSPIIHFAHANGFPAASYNKLFRGLDPCHELIAIDKFAHNPRFPLNDNWENQIKELEYYIESYLETINDEQNKSQGVIGIGHSFGAVVTYMTACLRPDLFKGLILLDPPLITGIARYVFRFAKSNRLINKITPAALTDNRVRKWHLEQDLYAYFSKKKLFKNFDPDCVVDYINAVIEEKHDIKQLTFEVETEANIFRTIPHNLPSFSGKLKTPTVLVTGKNTDVCVPTLRKPFLKANPIVEHIEFETGGHMFPLEHPEELSTLINSIMTERLGC